MKNILATLFLLTFSSFATAGSINYSDTNVGGTVFLGFAPAVSQAFYVTTNGNYDMEVLSANFDTVIYLYAGIPDLATATSAQALDSDDDGAGFPLSLISSVALTADTQYSLVTRGFAGATGSFTNQIRGVGDVILGEVSRVPVPASIALLALGLTGMGLQRRKQVKAA